MIIGYFGTFDDFMILMNVFMNVSWVFVWLSKLFVVEYYLELKVKKKKKTYLDTDYGVSWPYVLGPELREVSWLYVFRP
jgi:hypothetical protein